MDDDTLEALSDFWIMAELWGVQNSLERLREEQWLAASRIVASVESVTEAVDRLRTATQRQTRVIEAGFQSVAAALDFLTHVEKKVQYALYHPTETRALEARQLGEDYVHTKLYDDALKAFAEASGLFPSDFTCHFSTALIRLERLHDAEGAWESCEQALKYAPMWRGASTDPTPACLSSRSILLMGRMLEEGGLLEEALRYYEAACTASPDYGECFRRCASVAARLGQTDLALRVVRIAVLVDERECVLVKQDEGLASIADEVDALLASLREEALTAARCAREFAEGSVRAFARLDNALQGPNVIDAFDLLEESARTVLTGQLQRRAHLEDALNCAGQLHDRGALLDILHATKQWWRLGCEVRDHFQGLENFTRWFVDLLRQNAKEELASARQRLQTDLQEAEKMLNPFKLVGDWFSREPLWTFLLLFGALIPLAYPLDLLALVWYLDERKDAKRRKARAIEELGSEEELCAGRMSAASEVEAAGRYPSELKRLHVNCYELLDNSAIQCSVNLLDAGSKRDGYDESVLASALQEIAKAATETDTLSLEEVKNLIRDAPSMFVSRQPVGQAEHLADHLTSPLGLSAGIKRRYVGEFPPAGATQTEPA